MAYQTYTTDALVCGSYDRNTSDRSHLLFTREAGMLYADARSVREERSKQRYALQDFSHVRVSLVKGKGGWRVGSIEPFQNFYFNLTERAARAGSLRLMRTIRRFLHGSDIAPEVFDDIVATFARLGVCDDTHATALVTLAEFKLLYHLGYIAPHTSFTDVLTRPIATVTEHDLHALPEGIDAAIDAAISSSHL